MRNLKFSSMLPNWDNTSDSYMAEKILIGTLLNNCKIEPFNQIYSFLVYLSWILFLKHALFSNIFFLLGGGFEIFYIKLILFLVLCDNFSTSPNKTKNIFRRIEKN